ncbi:MAG: glycosyltransferase [Bacteroidetes bacterium]|nr:glycosyltransferase [Bacteroidota bacterium]
MDVFFDLLAYIVNNFIFGLTVIIFSSYLLLALISALALRTYLRKNSFVDYNNIILAPLTPSISVIAPAFNEEKSIVDNIRALLALYYNNFEVTVVNDGSTDNTFKTVIEAFDMERVNYFSIIVFPVNV